MFTTVDGMQWQLRLEPGNWPHANSMARQAKPTCSRLCVTAFPSPPERKRGSMHREVYAKLAIIQGTDRIVSPEWQVKMTFASSADDDGVLHPVQTSMDSFSRFMDPRKMRCNGLAQQLIISIEMRDLIPEKLEQETVTRPMAALTNRASASECLSFDSSEQSIGSPASNESAVVQHQYRGLFNEGTTCYLNSVMQSLFFIRTFRNAIYDVKTIQDARSIQELEKSIPFCM